MLTFATIQIDMCTCDACIDCGCQTCSQHTYKQIQSELESYLAIVYTFHYMGFQYSTPTLERGRKSACCLQVVCRRSSWQPSLRREDFQLGRNLVSRALHGLECSMLSQVGSTCCVILALMFSCCPFSVCAAMLATLLRACSLRLQMRQEIQNERMACSICIMF